MTFSPEKRLNSSHLFPGKHNAIPSNVVEKPLVNESLQVIESMMNGLRTLKKEIRKLQDGCEEDNVVTFDELEQTNEIIMNECTHVLIFEQKDESTNVSITRVFLCRRCKNHNIQILTCFDSIAHNSSLDNKVRYLRYHICKASEMLRECIGGCLFLYKLMNWVVKQTMFIERIYTFLLDGEKSTWLLSNEETHWSTGVIHEKIVKNHDFQFDTLHIYFTFSYENFSKSWQRICNRKKSPFRIVNNERLIFSNCTICNSSVVSTTFGERLDTGWNNVNFESVLSKEWCPIKLRIKT